ncbi:hypothetical protein LINPERPRIM_LOCUS41152, partial [Linum perenne]
FFFFSLFSTNPFYRRHPPPLSSFRLSFPSPVLLPYAGFAPPSVHRPTTSSRRQNLFPFFEIYFVCRLRSSRDLVHSLLCSQICSRQPRRQDLLLSVVAIDEIRSYRSRQDIFQVFVASFEICSSQPPLPRSCSASSMSKSCPEMMIADFGEQGS